MSEAAPAVESARGDRADQSDIMSGGPIEQLVIRSTDTGEVIAVFRDAHSSWTYFDICRRLEAEWPQPYFLRLAYQDRPIGRVHSVTLESLGIAPAEALVELQVSQVPVQSSSLREVAMSREEAITALSDINAFHVFQLSELNEPPPVAMLVCKAVGIIMRSGREWAKIRKDMAKRRFLSRLIHCDKDHFTALQLHALSECVQDPRFVPDDIPEPAASALASWCIFVHKYALVAAQMREHGIEYGQEEPEATPRWMGELQEEDNEDADPEDLEESVAEFPQGPLNIPQFSPPAIVPDTDDADDEADVTGRGTLVIRSQESGEVVATLEAASPMWTYFDVCRRLESAWPHENFLRLFHNGTPIERGHAQTLASLGVDLSPAAVAELQVVATTLPRASLHEVAAQRLAAMQALTQVARSDLEALNAVDDPPESAVMVYKALGALLGTESGIEGVRQVVGSAGFLPTLLEFDGDHQPPDQLSAAAQFVDSPGFAVAVAEGTALTALGLWCVFALSYGRLAGQMRELGLEDFAIIAGGGAGQPAQSADGQEDLDEPAASDATCLEADDAASVVNRDDVGPLPGLFPTRFAGMYGGGNIEAPRKTTGATPRGQLRIRSTQTGRVVAVFHGATRTWNVDDIRRKLRIVWPATKCREHFLSFQGRSLGVYSTLEKIGIDPAGPEEAELNVTLVKLIDHDWILSLEECYKQFQYAKLYLARITYKDLLELTSMADRPVAEKLVCQCVGILLGVGIEWETVKARLWSLWDFAFVDRLLEHNEPNITHDFWKFLQPYVDDPGFAPYSIRADAAFALGLWCVAVYNLGRQHAYTRDYQSELEAVSTIVSDV